ncbi:unnamed protein product [Ceutorhynchus assimilis]|uniref:Uncharacterized protein n=1 Tax=Ceutorhynchus assimilis TaxID=467358 RepID=A0A9N9M975_9CUCU|nr:unnamed protein product [Ceutorhynchus assimilis]
MIFVFVFGLIAFCDAKPGYSDSSNSENHLGHDSSMSSAGTGAGGYGYAGSFSGTGANGFPNFGAFVPQFDFSSFFDQLNKQHQEFIQHAGNGNGFSYSYSSAYNGGNAGGQSSIFFDNIPGNGIQRLSSGQGQAGGAASYAPNYQGSYQSSGAGGYSGGHGVDLGNRGGFVGGYGGGFSGPGGSYSFGGPIGGEGSGAAYASGSIGPNGGHQSAAVYPENPGSPNINTRFGGADSPQQGNNGGFKSVFTSSKSISSNINGKPQNFREASTTINDNGKITTYTAHNP